jgi:hypothetical protein
MKRPRLGYDRASFARNSKTLPAWRRGLGAPFIGLDEFVERGKDMPAMFDTHGKPHVAILGFRGFPCRLRVASA